MSTEVSQLSGAERAKHPPEAREKKTSRSKDTLFRRWNGPLTQELTLHPGDFGLGKVPARLKPDAVTRSVCGFCSTGCSLDVHLKNGEAINLTPTAQHPVNLGMACPKGWEALTPLESGDRATTPLLKEPSGEFKPVTWGEAMDTMTAKFKGIMAKHGPESVAFLGTGQICTEEMALLGALFKFGMGGIHCDSNTRQCMATAHVAYKQSFGFDAPPFTYADFEQSDLMVFVGSNLCIAHPIMWQRVLRNPRHPRIVVIDPRATETAMAASNHLALKPKSDLVLLYGVANILIQNGWVNRKFIAESTTGFDEYSAFVRQFTPDKVASETSLTIGQIYRLAEDIHTARAASFWWTMGVNQSHEATRTAQAIINLALITGNIGRPGTGANSITGQCNAMGSRLYSNITNLFGGRDFLNSSHRREVAELLGIPESTIPSQNSVAYDQIIDRVRSGEIRGLWIIATNTSHSWIHSQSFRELAANLEFLVVQDLYTTTETAKQANLILPAAGWGEKDGTFINSERRFGLVKKVRKAPGEALSDFNIFRLVAHHWGCAELLREWSSPEAVFQILKRMSKGRPCDITGIQDFRHLDESGGIQWPWTEIEAGNGGPVPIAMRERRLFEDGRFFTPDGKARLLFDPPRAPAESVSTEYPMVLLTGRGTSAQWHTQTRTGKSAVLQKLYPKSAYVEVHPVDAERGGIKPNSTVWVASKRGRISCTAFVTRTVQEGHVFMSMHYEETNFLTHPEFDPHSRQPAYKYCAVRLEPCKNGREARKGAKRS